MKITKFVHSCLLVEMPEPINRTALFDPGVMSEEALETDKLLYLDDIFITHAHSDHCSEVLIRQLVDKFPNVRITAPQQVVDQLSAAGIKASSEMPSGAQGFTAPHESLAPIAEQPENTGYHYLDMLSHPGDSHQFNETMPILALPVTAPWGSMISAINLALKLQPKYVLPIHDWHWNEDARNQAYEKLQSVLANYDIEFCKLKTGEPTVIQL